MGKRDEERLNQTLSTHMSNIHETLQILDQKPSSSLQKVNWEDCIKISEQLSKHATTAGMLFTEKTEVKALEENMGVYFNALQGLVLYGYGSTAVAGPTLSSNIHASLKNVVDCSFKLWCECVSSYGSHKKEKNQTIPQMVGTVWDACSALKKTPSTNITAIGREMTRVAVSIKDVLRELKELEPSPSETQPEVSNVSDNDDDDIGKDLSPGEMKVVDLVMAIVSEVLNLIKELIRLITGLLGKGGLVEEKPCVDSLEELLSLSRGVGVFVDELGACLYPPQEISAIRKACKDISSRTDDMEKSLESINGSTEAFSLSCKSLKKAMELLNSEISSSTDADIVSEMGNLAV